MNFHKSSIAAFALMQVAGSGSAGEAHLLATNAPACIVLRDQYDAPQKLSFPTTNITVLTIADRKGSDQVDGWIAALKLRYSGRIHLRGLAEVGSVPAFLRRKIRKRFQETRTYPVMMDWSGKVCARLGYQPDLANILILGRDGSILGRFTGGAVETNRAAAFDALDKALLVQHPARNHRRENHHRCESINNRGSKRGRSTANV